MKKVLIVARTKMTGKVCIGAIDLKTKKSLRLLTKNRGYQPADSPFHVKQIWPLDWTTPLAHELTPPHTENVYITSSSQCVKEQKYIRSYIINNCRIWDNIEELFSGCLKYKPDNNKAYIERPKVPTISTGYWKLEERLELHTDNKNKEFYGNNKIRLSYSGCQKAKNMIPKNTLVRVSLAKWWRPNSDPQTPLRCYLMLSGWYEE